MGAASSNVQSLGLVMFTHYLIPFELSAVMLLVAMISGIVLVSRRMDSSITLSEEADGEEDL